MMDLAQFYPKRWVQRDAPLLSSPSVNFSISAKATSLNQEAPIHLRRNEMRGSDCGVDSAPIQPLCTESA